MRTPQLFCVRKCAQYALMRTSRKQKLDIYRCLNLYFNAGVELRLHKACFRACSSDNQIR